MYLAVLTHFFMRSTMTVDEFYFLPARRATLFIEPGIMSTRLLRMEAFINGLLVSEENDSAVTVDSVISPSRNRTHKTKPQRHQDLKKAAIDSSCVSGAHALSLAASTYEISGGSGILLSRKPTQFLGSIELNRLRGYAGTK